MGILDKILYFFTGVGISDTVCDITTPSYDIAPIHFITRHKVDKWLKEQNRLAEIRWQKHIILSDRAKLQYRENGRFSKIHDYQI